MLQKYSSRLKYDILPKIVNSNLEKTRIMAEILWT